MDFKKKAFGLQKKNYFSVVQNCHKIFINFHCGQTRSGQVNSGQVVSRTIWCGTGKE